MQPIKSAEREPLLMAIGIGVSPVFGGAPSSITGGGGSGGGGATNHLLDGSGNVLAVTVAVDRLTNA